MPGVAALAVAMLTGCTSPKGEPQTFEIGNKEFLLNGKPFLIKAAEIHYTRIPAEYWEHRIEMCKALGMNTICIYAFWNIHEQRPGEFDFEGQNDVARFCRLAQKHGMYIMLRPGPYVCSEWEMGGLPWWLLKKKDIALRTSDPYFLERTKIFMNELGKQLADLQAPAEETSSWCRWKTNTELMPKTRNTSLPSVTSYAEPDSLMCPCSSVTGHLPSSAMASTICSGPSTSVREQISTSSSRLFGKPGLKLRSCAANTGADGLTTGDASTKPARLT